MYRHVLLSHFKRQLRQHAKKYRHLKEAVISVLSDFDARQHVHVGSGVYKVRFSTKDVRRGKSGSFRMMVLVAEKEEYLVPVCLWFKGDREDIPKKELNAHLEHILFELRAENLVE